MTNAEIIENQSKILVQEGILKTIGGMPEPIHTFAGWKERGFQVKKGEKSFIKITIWKYTEKEIEAGAEIKIASSMFTKVASFFTMAQVERIKENV